MLIFYYKKILRQRFFKHALFLVNKINQKIFSFKFLPNNLKNFFFEISSSSNNSYHEKMGQYVN